jgi:hypothetical protein
MYAKSEIFDAHVFKLEVLEPGSRLAGIDTGCSTLYILAYRV